MNLDHGVKSLQRFKFSIKDGPFQPIYLWIQTFILDFQIIYFCVRVQMWKILPNPFKQFSDHLSPTLP